jgi:ATP-dependent helicase HrpB
MSLESLPIDRSIPDICAQIDRHRALILSAAPGAGKSTRVPPALTAAGSVILLQPRRVAARAVATRIAQEQGWTIGREVGWQIRFEKRFSRDTRLLVVTEGILAARLQQDPLLSDFTTIVLDEFHERSVHADLGLALARQAWLARTDLRIVVMSATLDDGEVSRFLDGAPVLTVPGVPHPLTVEYAPTQSIGDAVRELVPRTQGQLLCFLPGRREIERAQDGVDALGRFVRPRGRRAAWIARRRGAGRCDSRVSGATGHLVHEHRRDVVDGARRIGGDRRGTGEGGAVRRRARRR